MRKILGLDIGDKRIGVAVSDDLAITAQSIGTIRRKNMEYDIDKIKEIIKKRNVELLVVGMPYRTDEEGNKLTHQGRKIRQFIEELKQRVDISIKLQDESYTTKESERVLKEGKVKRKDYNEAKDKISAQLILQTFLDKNEIQD